MKKNVLFVVVCTFLLAFASTGFSMDSAVSAVSFQNEASKITVEQARKIALKRVEGTIEDEYTLEDDEGEIDTFVFMIKTKAGKTFEVQVEASKGDVVSVEEFTDDTDDSDDEDPPLISRY